MKKNSGSHVTPTTTRAVRAMTMIHVTEPVTEKESVTESGSESENETEDEGEEYGFLAG